jgi:predicted phage tail protein
MSELVEINFHGVLGECLPKNVWKLAVKSVGEAMRAVEMLSGYILYKSINKLSKKNVKYCLMINGEYFKTEQELNPEKPETIQNSELCMTKKIESLDIIPIIEGAEGFLDIFTVILGVALIAVGFFTGVGPVWGTALVIAGLGLLAAGITNLLTSPPKFEDFREIEGGGSRSYLFNGPQNTTREGGPVPLLYGELIVGSQVISTTYDVINIAASTTTAIPTNNSGNQSAGAGKPFRFAYRPN